MPIFKRTDRENLPDKDELLKSAQKLLEPANIRTEALVAKDATNEAIEENPGKTTKELLPIIKEKIQEIIKIKGFLPKKDRYKKD